MKILLLGNTGQLGYELNRTLLSLGDLVALDFPQVDISDPDNIRSIVRQHQPSLVINATAYTNVDKAESEPELAMAINGTGPGILAEEVKNLRGALIHYSTDYVFDGTKGEAYVESDEPTPLSVYGETKLAGEQAVQSVGGAYLIFRTSWVYSMRRPCFVTKVLEWARKHETLRIVDDQISTPTWARLLAETTTQVIAQGKDHVIEYVAENSGLYHLSGNGSCSRFEWAQSILTLDPEKESQVTKELLPASSNDFVTAAQRPLRSTLSCKKLERKFSLRLPDWQDALQLAMQS
ncbi:MAG: dTDP-4-dehydrorhamnose reductase [Brevefilum sp.]|nr:dTDP-4-dehydrorhamnose reductase [Brevefilum sp.]MDW7754634.1 dTDP-4-dehydrorhamnose reductase [Brevefilum sp.]